jgi:hypothetical protein
MVQKPQRLARIDALGFLQCPSRGAMVRIDRDYFAIVCERTRGHPLPFAAQREHEALPRVGRGRLRRTPAFVVDLA